MGERSIPLVRLAQPEDEPEILEMCKRLHKENGLFSLNEEKVQACIRKYYERAGVIVGVIGLPGKLEASTCLQLSDFYYTDEWHLAELWNFVDEPHRRSHNAEALIEFGKSCADKMKMPLFTGIITNKQMAGKVRLYRRALGNPTGAFFIYNARWQTEPMEDNSALRTRLREAAKTCATTPGRYTRKENIAQLSSLLKEAAETLDRNDNFWGSATKLNGVSTA